MDWSQRFVVFDCETTGTNPEKDYLVSIGAVVIEQGLIELAESFETLVRVPFNTASVVVHGITQQESLEGLEQPEAVRQFLMFVGESPLVGHHVGFDLTLLRRIAQQRLSRSIANPAIDTMQLMIHLAKEGAFGEPEEVTRYDLDGLCERFQVQPHDRHTAIGDAFITAQIFLKLSRAAKRCNIEPEFWAP